jgi:formate C-acetyltransferase
MKYTWIKIEECGAILNMTIGGRLADGSCAINPLTYLAMRATREMGFRSPNLSLRIRAGDPDELWQAAHQTLSTGQGLPALYNEDLIASMLAELGYPEREALDYSLAGCSQVILPGRSNFACDVGCYNLLKALELALHDGYDPILGQQVGPHTGALETLDSYDRLEQAYHRQMRSMTRLGVAINDKDMFLRQKEGACVRSLLTMDCLEQGRGIFHGGARFYNIQNEACGITNTANALVALKTLVFEEGVISLDRLVAILDHDWEGQEALRLRFKNKPAKFGNNQAEVDAIRARIAADWYHEIQQYPAVLGGFHWPGEVVFVYHEQHGAYTAASADGRKAREPLANSAGATSGTDLSGPTALMNSMWKIPQDQCRTCCVLNLRFSKKVWKEAWQAMQDLMQTYFSQGGYQMQVNLVSRDELLAARQNPEQYASLIVRVGGFSDYYVRLSASLQEEILARTEHEL